ncbi:MAG: hypothetical protein KatS3mg011_2186 [Acidimicrobiia bacterium]|nr:MAG: hypothetical protein KatS3mg011_2186 [Acidimicrobiia bacterium]
MPDVTMSEPVPAESMSLDIPVMRCLPVLLEEVE